MELTQEHFDKALKAAVAPLATKKDLEEQTEALARMVADTIATPFTQRFDRLEELLNIRDRVERHELVIKNLEMKAGLRLDW